MKTLVILVSNIFSSIGLKFYLSIEVWPGGTIMACSMACSQCHNFSSCFNLFPKNSIMAIDDFDLLYIFTFCTRNNVCRNAKECSPVIIFTIVALCISQSMRLPLVMSDAQFKEWRGCSFLSKAKYEDNTGYIAHEKHQGSRALKRHWR